MKPRSDYYQQRAPLFTSTREEKEGDGIYYDTIGSSRDTAKNVKTKSSAGRAFGVGVLNDTGSDDEDPYDLGPRVSYNRVIGGPKKKKKQLENGRSTANPLLGAKPIFVSKKLSSRSSNSGFRKCHDGRLPLDGFVLSIDNESIASIVNQDGKYTPPEVPKDWKSAKAPSELSALESKTFQSTADAAKATKLDPTSRASLLGQEQLPGKSVFDFLTPAARERLASASGNENLPVARGESLPQGSAPTGTEQQKQLWNLIPPLDKEIALKALGRGIGGWMPYADDEAKRIRYRSFLEGRAGLRGGLPEQASGMTKADWVKELQEFAHAAEIFRPMTGMMASRFTSAGPPKIASDALDPKESRSDSLVTQPSRKQEDPAETAAKMGMFGPLTRSTQRFFPTRLLCKRFNVKPPAHVQVDVGKPSQTNDSGSAGESGQRSFRSSGFQTSSSKQAQKPSELVSQSAINDMLQESAARHSDPGKALGQEGGEIAREQAVEMAIDAQCNPALEAQRPGDSVFKAIFGSDNDDDDEED